MTDYTYSVLVHQAGKPHIPALKVEGERKCEEQPDMKVGNLEREAHLLRKLI